MPNQELAPEQELKRSAEALNKDGTVDVTVLDWEKIDDGVEVTFRTPTMDECSEKMDWPEPGEDFEEYKFVRLLREAGLEVSEPNQLHGHVTSARLESKSPIRDPIWVLEPSPPVPVRERVSVDPSLMVWAHFAVIVLSVLLMILVTVIVSL